MVSIQLSLCECLIDYFLVQLVSARQQLRAAQDAASGRAAACARIERPRIIHNLQAEIGLENDSFTYKLLTVSFFFLAKHVH